MNIFASLIDLSDELPTSKVRYYTIQIVGEEHNVFEQFILRHQQEPSLTEEFNDLLAWITIRMGEQRGALERFFRHERMAKALPPPPRYLEINYEHQLRLYCMRIIDRIVILFDGAVKTAATAQECPIVGPHFRMANQYADAIDQALRTGDICICPHRGDRLIYSDDFELMIRV